MAEQEEIPLEEEITFADEEALKEEENLSGIEEISLDNHDVSLEKESLEDTIILEDGLDMEEIDKKKQDETKGD